MKLAYNYNIVNFWNLESKEYTHSPQVISTCSTTLKNYDGTEWGGVMSGPQSCSHFNTPRVMWSQSGHWVSSLQLQHWNELQSYDWILEHQLGIRRHNENVISQHIDKLNQRQLWTNWESVKILIPAKSKIAREFLRQFYFKLNFTMFKMVIFCLSSNCKWKTIDNCHQFISWFLNILKL